MNHFTASFGPPVLAAADGSRPWQSHTYGCTILFAGYISNRVELCRLLALPVETSESECMAAAYRSYGTRLAAHVFGEFAAAIYDPTDPLGSSIVLVHDAFGVLPIFYSLQSDQLLFGTNLEAIVAVTGTRTLDELYFARYLAVADNFDGRTPYCHIRSVPQCAAATVRNGVAKTMVAYAPGQVEVLGLETPSAYEERFRELVTQAVAAVIPSSGKVWCELSGGLDSSTVISLASGVLHASFETYSYHFSRSREADETRWREIVLEAFSLRSHLLDADATPPFSGIPQQFQAEPSGTSIVLALDAARRHIFRQHDVDFVITGMCGDAVFIGDSPEPFFLADIRNPQKLFSQLRYWGTHNPNRRSLAYWHRQSRSR